ncbi:flagellar export chaperone FliS [Pseudoxanthomonas wuyuanensis]
MSPHSYAAQYRNTGLSSAVMDADPHRLVALLLAGACDRIRLAEACVARGDLARKGKAIGEVCAIIGHLNGSLDHEAGGEIAGSLSALYDYLQGRLIEANLNNDESALREALDLLGEIESAWNAIPLDQRQQPAVGASA